MTGKGGTYGVLLERLHGIGRCAVAFSGGVDSSFLLAAAKSALGDNVLAVTADLPHIPRRQQESSLRMARDLGVEPLVLSLPLPGSILENPRDRCYLCKSYIFSRIRQAARKKGFEHVAEGTNADDPAEHRPGLRALAEMNILSPLRDCGFTKEDIRGTSRRLKLPGWNRPADTCLLTRFPYETPVTRRDLGRVEASEAYLESLGFSGLRVRVHGEVARVEVAPGRIGRFLKKALSDSVAGHLRALGFRHVCLDLEGYCRGCFDGTILEKGKNGEP